LLPRSPVTKPGAVRNFAGICAVYADKSGVLMAIFSGHCTLIVDGKAEYDCTVALEIADRDRGRYGFLSVLPELLKQTQSAKQLQILLPSGEILDVKLRQLSLTGVALISIAPGAHADTGTPLQYDSVPQELTTIDKLRALVEDHLKAEGLFNTTVTLQANLDESMAGHWGVKNFAGSDDRLLVINALDRLIPELQKRFRL
jgi:hypothetical protein